MAKKSISADQFDKLFDSGEDISEYLDAKTASKKVNVDFNVEMVKMLDYFSKRIGITRQSLIKMWLYERIKQEINSNKA